MSWTFTVTRPDGTTKSITVRNPELNDVDRTSFRQGRGTTDAGLVYVQDLDDEDQVIEASWGFLREFGPKSERGDFEDFFGRGGTVRQAFPFDIDITGSSFPQTIKAGMVIGGSVIQAGQGLKAGQTVTPDVSNLRNVFLDQAELAFDQERDGSFSLDLRLRIHRPAG